jgi:hypothetical protein
MKKRIVETGAFLDAPEEYWSLSGDAKEKVCNGCGAKGGIPVPDTIWGLDVSECCNIHDLGYAMGRTIEDKDSADRTFLNNMLRTLEVATDNGQLFGLIKHFRRSRIKAYYETVHFYGGPSFWKGEK